jgi:hypothetical protein
MISLCQSLQQNYHCSLFLPACVISGLQVLLFQRGAFLPSIENIEFYPVYYCLHKVKKSQLTKGDDVGTT